MRMPRVFPPLALAAVAGLAANDVQAQRVISDNVEIEGYLYVESDLDVSGTRANFDGGICISDHCDIYETFTYPDGLKLKNYSNSILFDSSVLSGFPQTDWRLQGNDVAPFAGGGMDRFFLQDVTSQTEPFTVEGGAPSSSLWIDNEGSVGLGTMLPQSQLHLNSLDPRVTLEYSGVEPTSFDLTTNNTYFLLTNSLTSQIPFLVAKGATGGMLIVGNGGQYPQGVGIGAVATEARLEVKSIEEEEPVGVLIERVVAATEPHGLLTLRNNGITWMTLEDTSIAAGDYSGRSWNFQNQGGTFRVTTAPGGPGEIEMQLDAQGDMYIKGQLYTGTGGATTTCAAGCDAVFAGDYELPSFAEQMAAIREGGHLPAVGPTDENGPHNLSQMVGGTLNELEKAYLYIDELVATVADQEARIARLEQRLEADSR